MSLDGELMTVRERRISIHVRLVQAYSMSVWRSLLAGHMHIEPSPYGRAVPMDVSGCGVGHPLLLIKRMHCATKIRFDRWSYGFAWESRIRSVGIGLSMTSAREYLSLLICQTSPLPTDRLSSQYSAPDRCTLCLFFCNDQKFLAPPVMSAPTESNSKRLSATGATRFKQLGKASQVGSGVSASAISSLLAKTISSDPSPLGSSPIAADMLLGEAPSLRYSSLGCIAYAYRIVTSCDTHSQSDYYRVVASLDQRLALMIRNKYPRVDLRCINIQRKYTVSRVELRASWGTTRSQLQAA